MKSFLLSISFYFMLTTLYAQDKVNIFVNEKAVSHFIIGEEPVTISLKRFNVLKTKNISVNYQVVNPSPYKQSLELTDLKEQHNTVIPLHGTKKENIYAALKKYKFFKCENIKIYLLLNPANDMMLMPSRRIYLGELTIK
ncbi:MAG: hypothetical protein ABIW38_13495 [Ferruginibacter sp.]